MWYIWYDEQWDDEEDSRITCYSIQYFPSDVCHHLLRTACHLIHGKAKFRKIYGFLTSVSNNEEKEVTFDSWSTHEYSLIVGFAWLICDGQHTPFTSLDLWRERGNWQIEHFITLITGDFKAQSKPLLSINFSFFQPYRLVTGSCKHASGVSSPNRPAKPIDCHSTQPSDNTDFPHKRRIIQKEKGKGKEVPSSRRHRRSSRHKSPTRGLLYWCETQT